MMHIEPLTLTGKHVRLEPLQLSHAAALLRAGHDQDIWTFMSFNASASAEAMEAWIIEALSLQQAGTCLPFVVIDQCNGHVVGSTRYLDIVAKNYGLEIGWTWLAPEVRRTVVNTECKYLLLRHAFEDLQAIRIQLKTDSRNVRSQRAIERIGGIKEGVLRNHVIMPDGYYRHSVYYSILNTEWEQVGHNLRAKLTQAY